MSILIKGMEMPKNEPLLVKINPDGSVSTTARNGYKKYEAIPVPPHGRLGDLDEINEKHDKLSRDFCHGYFKNTWDFVCAARKLFYDAPTIIEADHIVDATKMVNVEEDE